MEFEGASAIVTGGASGLGEATARRRAGQGVKVVVLDLQDERGDALATEIGGRYVHADVTSPADVISAIDAAAELGQLRILVNCAGIGGSARTVGRDGTYESAFPLERFTKIVTVNLIGTFNCTRLAATAIAKAPVDAAGERGAIVNTASVAAFDGQIGQAGYSASKGGIVGLTLPLARDLAAVGVRVNTIAPGLIDTPIYDGFPDPAAAKAQLAANVIFPKRLGTADEFASMAMSLLENTYMNGETIRIDGAARLPAK
jgi:NAD(P)-dependent dehydrogenase (short-subunit alcohol dehydrogenase family)